VKDLAVDDPTPRRSVHDDPAVLGVRIRAQPVPSLSDAHIPSQASAPNAPATPYTQYSNPTQSFPTGPSAPPQPQPQVQNAQPPHTTQQLRVAQQPPQPSLQSQQDSTSPPPSQPSQPSRPQGQGQRSNSVHTAAASLETVQRALGDLRVSNGSNGAGPRHGSGHGRRGQHGPHGHALKTGEIKVPATDFDFQSSNARFDKAALAPRKSASNDGEKVLEDDEATNPSDQEDDTRAKPRLDKKEKDENVAYNPHKSFFDSLSSSNTLMGRTDNGGDSTMSSGRGGRRGGGTGGRNRREEERERNVATFGEPGGVGLMGPGG